MNAYVKPEDFREPEDFPERVLFLSLGTSSQIITEVIYALTVGRVKTGEKQFVPTKVIVLSTTTGIDKARSMLDSSGRYHLLGTDYGLELPEIEYRVIADNNNMPMDDIRTAADAMQAADCTLRNLRELTENNESAIHVSLAGGRKTQGYYTGEATSLFARPQDRLSHVLVSEGYEGNPEFFYPTTSEKMIKCRLGGELVDLDANKAVVELADLPFQRRREQLPGFLLKQSGEGLSVILRKLELAESEFAITLNTATCELEIGEFSFSLEERQFALLLMASLVDEQTGLRGFKKPSKSMNEKKLAHLTRLNGLNFFKAWLVAKGLPLSILEKETDVDQFDFYDALDTDLSINMDAVDIAKKLIPGFETEITANQNNIDARFLESFVNNGGMSYKWTDNLTTELKNSITDFFGPKIYQQMFRGRKDGMVEVVLSDELINII